MKGIEMGHSEDYIRNKMYEIEKEKLVIDRNINKVLADIRDLFMAYNIIKLTELAESPNMGEENFKRAKDAFVEVKNLIEKRWSE